jgi:hypothetical protein
MRPVRTLSLSLLVALTGCLASASGASAAAKTLTLETAAGPLPPGAPIAFSSSDLINETPQGNDECTEHVLTGTVSANQAKTVAISFSEASFTGDESEETFGCKDSDPLGPSSWSAEELPWPLTLGAHGTGKLKGSPKIMMREDYFNEAPKTVCYWVAGKLLMTFAQTATTPEPLTLTLTRQPFKIERKRSNGRCPSQGQLNGHFTATSGGETVSAHT